MFNLDQKGGNPDSLMFLVAGIVEERCAAAASGANVGTDGGMDEIPEMKSFSGIHGNR